VVINTYVIQMRNVIRGDIVRRCYDYTKIYSNLVDVWKCLVEELNHINRFEPKFNRSIKKLKGHFLEVAGEMWVAAELQKRHHEVKVERKQKHADLYIENFGIEVKGGTRRIEETNHGNIPRWGYSFDDGRQLRERDFQICVLVRANENSIPFDCFVITRQELNRHPIPLRKPRVGKKNKVIIRILEPEDFDIFRALMASWGWREETEIEKRLHQQRSDFKDRWDKIEEALR